MKRYPFRIALRTPVGRVTERSGWLIEGPEGWGEMSPMPGATPAEVAASEAFAIEAATMPFPRAVRDRVEVNVLVPAVPPEEAGTFALEGGCRTVKVKVGDANGEARLRAVRDAVGPGVRLRADANGSWDILTAETMLRRLATYDLEYVEDPVASLEDLAAVRRRSPVPIAADAGVRSLEDARRLRRLGAADVVVIKTQRVGGVRAALAIAEEVGVPAVPSSSLETSVGLAAGLAFAAALPDLPFACGLGTALLLGDDVVADPLIPVDGTICPRRPRVDPAALARVRPAPAEGIRP